jgi:hypothetical protein
MPQRRIQRSQLRVPNTHASMESLQASLSQITPVSKGCFTSLPEYEINDDHSAETQVHEDPCDPNNGNGDEDEDHSILPEGKDKRGRDDMLSMITEDDQKVMLEQNRMLQ